MAVYDRELLNLTVDVDNSAVEMEVFSLDRSWRSERRVLQIGRSAF